MNISSRPFSLETRSKERLDLCVVRMTTGYSETADAMKLATPLMPKRPRVTGVRMPLLVRPGATYPAYNRSWSSKKSQGSGRRTSISSVWPEAGQASRRLSHRDWKRLPSDFNQLFSPFARKGDTGRKQTVAAQAAHILETNVTPNDRVERIGGLMNQ